MIKKELQDPVCKMIVTHDRYQTRYQSKTYYFCSRGCLEKFEKAPHTYTHLQYVLSRALLKAIRKIRKQFHAFGKAPLIGLGLAAPITAPTAASHTTTQYTCPMHPEVISTNPHDTCPQCGMDLEPILTSGTSTHTTIHERIHNRRLVARFILATLLTLPIMLVEMVPGVRGALPYTPILTLILTTLILFGPGSFVFTRALSAVKHRTLNMFSLIALGTLTAYLYSAVLLSFSYIMPEWIPPLARDATGQPQVYFETAATIITLVILGQVLESMARTRTNRAIRNLMDLSPATALRIHPTYKDQALASTPTTLPAAAYEDIPLPAIKKGDILLVQPGAKVPVDGVVLSGQSEVDEAVLTGEAHLVLKTAGTSLIGGSLNKTGAFTMRAEKVGAETFLAEIIALTETAQRSHPPIQDLTERVTRIFIPSVIAIAVLSFGIWLVWGPEPRLSHALLAFVSVLIVACPCALGLATPMAITVGMSRGTEKGVLIKDATLLERFSAITLIALDKTGTLTQGRPELIQTEIHDKTLSTKKAIQLAASLEALSEHPLAHGFKTALQTHKLPFLPVSQFRAIPGEGIEGILAGKPDAPPRAKSYAKPYAIGSPSMLKRLGVPLPKSQTSPTTSLTTRLFLTNHKKVLATFSLADTLKPSAAPALTALKHRNIKIVVLSGDRQANCDEVGTALGLTEVYGDLRPQDKFEKIDAFKRAGHTVMMAGDGVNDAPALARADLSVAMGAGSDAALSAAHATLLKGDLQSLNSLFVLSQKTLANIKSNLFFAFCYNAASVPIAAGLLYPLWNLTFSPMLAALLMILSSLSVIGNALRLRRMPLS